MLNLSVKARSTSRCGLGADKTVSSKAFYEAYQKWAEELGERPRRQKRILPEMRRPGIKKVKSSSMRLEGGSRRTDDEGLDW